MNNWQNEYMAEYHRQDLLAEVEQIRLEKIVREAQIRCPNQFERTIVAFANWMISKGRQLRKQYTRSSPVDGSPAINCGKSPTGSFAN